MTSIDARDQLGPFDIIGDVHGCADELEQLLGLLGYSVTWRGMGTERACTVVASHGRRAIFVGDLVDRGPRTPDALRIVLSMAACGLAFCVPGNHDVKFVRWSKGANLKVANGLAETIAQMHEETPGLREAARAFFEGLPSHLWLDEGRLAVSHAGLREDMIGHDSGDVRAFCLYGDTTGESDEFGLPVRRDWALHYRGGVHVVYGHTPVVEAEWFNRTICIDTGCVFGGKLTALRWPENVLVSVPARDVYMRPSRPLKGPRGA